MADKNFIVKNGITVKGPSTFDSSVDVIGTITQGNLPVATQAYVTTQVSSGTANIIGASFQSDTIKFPDSDASHFVTLKSPHSPFSSNLSFHLPPSDGTSGQALVTDGEGHLGFAAAGATISSDTSTNTDFKLYFATTTSGALTAVKQDSGLTYNPSTGMITSSVSAVTEQRFLDSNASNYVGFGQPVSPTSNVIWTLPNADGSAGQALVTSGDKTLSWAAAGAVTTADESTDTDFTIKFDAATSGAVTAIKHDTGLTYNPSSGTLSVGNLTVSGTVDGADVAALKTKLDGIEASATADQTDAEIRAAVEAATNSNVFTDADHTKLNAIEASADVTDTVNVVAALTAGTNVAIASDGTISSTDTNTTYSVQDGQLSENNFTNADHTKLNAIETGATADQTDAEIKTAYENNSNTNAFTDADHSKLDGIEASATADQTGAQIKVAYEAEANTNAFTDSDHTKLNAIEESATADQTAAEIRALVESATNSNVFTDADHSKLNAIEASADVTDTTNVVAALTAGTNVAIASDGTISATDTNTTYSVGDGELSEINFTSADNTKLDGIEANATADQTKSDIEGLGIDLPAANLTGTIASARLSTATTQAESNNSTKIATTEYVTNKITTLIGGAPSTLNDLNELAAAINDDANYNTTLTTALATKLPLSGGAMTGAITTNSTFDGRDVATDGAKLDGIASGATNTVGNATHTGEVTGSGALTIAADVVDAGNLKVTGNGTTSQFLRSDGDGTFTWATPTDTNTTYSVGDGGLSEINFTSADHSKLNGIAASANNYSHPTHPGDDASIDTGALTGATVISDLDFNITTDTLGHVTDANATVATRTLTLANLGYTGDTNANNTVTNATHTGEVTGSGALTIADNVVDAGNLKVTGNGSTSQFLRSDGDGTFTWATPTDTNTTYSAGSGLGLSGTTFSHSDTSSQSSSNNSGRTYIQDITLDTYGHVTGLATATETVTNTDTNTNQLTTFQLEDGDGTEVTVSHGKEVKFTEGQGINVNWTDTSTGSDGDPYDMEFALKADGVRANELNVSGNGTTSQFLRSDGDGSFTWATPTDTNTTYSVGDGGLTQKNFTSTLKSKLDGIETGATADQSAAQILAALKTVDVNGSSGVNAGTLDGQSASYYRINVYNSSGTLLN